MALHAATVEIAQIEQNRAQEPPVLRTGQAKTKLIVMQDVSNRRTGLRGIGLATKMALAVRLRPLHGIFKKRRAGA